MWSRRVTGFELHFAVMALAAVWTKDSEGLREKRRLIGTFMAPVRGRGEDGID